MKREMKIIKLLSERKSFLSIHELAEYEGMLDEVVADEITLETWIFDHKKAEVIFVLDPISEYGEKPLFLRFIRVASCSNLFI